MGSEGSYLVRLFLLFPSPSFFWPLGSTAARARTECQSADPVGGGPGRGRSRRYAVGGVGVQGASFIGCGLLAVVARPRFAPSRRRGDPLELRLSASRLATFGGALVVSGRLVTKQGGWKASEGYQSRGKTFRGPPVEALELTGRLAVRWFSDFAPTLAVPRALL